jgi:hypothetical protein
LHVFSHMWKQTGKKDLGLLKTENVLGMDCKGWIVVGRRKVDRHDPCTMYAFTVFSLICTINVVIIINELVESGKKIILYQKTPFLKSWTFPFYIILSI